MANVLEVDIVVDANDALKDVDKIERRLNQAEQNLKSSGQQMDLLASHMGPVGAKFQQITGLVEQFGVAFGVAGGVAAGAVAGFAVAAGGLAVLGKAVWDITTSTAEFAGKFQDLSQQIGLSVESLSTLEVLASNTGGNIDSVTASLGLFQTTLEAAHDPTSKEARLLASLGVTSADTEIALEQALKGLHALGEGSEQTAKALDLFGRSGRFFNAILKESGGDIGKATEELQKMGLIISTQAAVAADQFNDNLNLINRQLAAVTYTIGNEAIPVFIVFFESMSKGLTGQQDAWKVWANVVKIETAVVLGSIQGLYLFLESVAKGGPLDPVALLAAVDASIKQIIDRADQYTMAADVKRVAAEALAAATALGKLPGATDADAQKKLNAEMEQTKKNQEAIAAGYQDTRTFLDEMNQRVNKDNPFVKLFSEADTVMARMQKRFGVFGDEFVNMMAKVENAAIDQEKLAARIESANKVLDIQAEIRRLKLGQIGPSAEEQRMLSILDKQIAAARDVPTLLAQAEAIEQGRRPEQINEAAVVQEQLNEIAMLRAQFTGDVYAQRKINEEIIAMFERATPAMQAAMLRGTFREDLAAAKRGQAEDRRQAVEDEIKRAAAARIAVQTAQAKIADLAARGGFGDDAIRKQYLAVTGGLSPAEMTGEMRQGRMAALQVEATKEAQKEQKAEEDRKKLNGFLDSVSKQIAGQGIPVSMTKAGVLVEVKDTSNKATVTGPGFSSADAAAEGRRTMQGL